jgi:hypothetical protein
LYLSEISYIVSKKNFKVETPTQFMAVTTLKNPFANSSLLQVKFTAKKTL